jgi:intermembrane space import and assembly protein 40
MSTSKDKVIFCTKADHETPSKYEPPAPLPGEERRGVLLPNGEINWTCPCLGGLPYGPCGFEFREFFSCLPQFSKETTGKDSEQEQKDDAKKAEECFPKFTAMKECFSQFPKLYPPDEDDDELLSGSTKTETH